MARSSDFSEASEPEEPLEALVEAFLARALPRFGQLISCERLSGGASQETYRLEASVGGRKRSYALRRQVGGAASLPAGEEPAKRPDLATEARLMRLARDAGVPEPRVLATLSPGDGLGEGFLMEWLEGETLGSRVVRSDDLASIRPTLARRCGEILARIHSIDVESTGLDSLLETTPPRLLVENTWQRYKELATPQPMIDYTACWLLDNLPAEHQTCLVHGDFRNGNLMVTPKGVAAVLDWELAHIGDPLRDLGWLCTASWRFGSELPVGGFGHYEDLIEGYESKSGNKLSLDHLHFWEVFGSFWWSVGCLLMAHHFRTGPDRSIERAAIGRRSSECQVDCVNLLIPGPVDLVTSAEPKPSADLPSTTELVIGVRDFLRDEILGSSQGRPRFLARVAANALDVVLRQEATGEALQRHEWVLLRRLFDSEATVKDLKWRLVHSLRARALSLADPGLQKYLRDSTVNQLAIDQPSYPGLKWALQGSS